MPNLRVFVKVYNNDNHEYVDGFDTYLSDSNEIPLKWEMAEMELGSLQRRLEKKLLDNEK